MREKGSDGTHLKKKKSYKLKKKSVKTCINTSIYIKRYVWKEKFASGITGNLIFFE